MFFLGGGGGRNWSIKILTGKVNFPSITRLEQRSLEHSKGWKSTARLDR